MFLKSRHAFPVLIASGGLSGRPWPGRLRPPKEAPLYIGIDIPLLGSCRPVKSEIGPNPETKNSFLMINNRRIPSADIVVDRRSSPKVRRGRSGGGGGGLGGATEGVVKRLASTSKLASSGAPLDPIHRSVPPEPAPSRRAMEIVRILAKISAKQGLPGPKRPVLARMLTAIGVICLVRRDGREERGVKAGGHLCGIGLQATLEVETE